MHLRHIWSYTAHDYADKQNWEDLRIVAQAVRRHRSLYEGLRVLLGRDVQLMHTWNVDGTRTKRRC